MAGRLRKRQKLSFNAHNQNPKSKIQNPSHKRAGDKKARQRNITNNTKLRSHQNNMRNESGTQGTHESKLRQSDKE